MPSLYNIEKYQVAEMSKLEIFSSAVKSHHRSCCNQDQVDQDGVFGKNIRKDDLFKIRNARFHIKEADLKNQGVEVLKCCQAVFKKT